MGIVLSFPTAPGWRTAQLREVEAAVRLAGHPPECVQAVSRRIDEQLPGVAAAIDAAASLRLEPAAATLVGSVYGELLSQLVRSAVNLWQAGALE
jgi:hypothetical protein